MSCEPEPEDLVCRAPSDDSRTTSDVSGSTTTIPTARAVPSRGETRAYDTTEPPAPSAGTEYLLARATKAQRPVVPPALATANSSAQRTAQRPEAKPYADAGVTSSRDSLYAEAALLKGRDAATGIEVEAFDVSAQVGAQNELRAVLVRVGFSSDDGIASGSHEVVSARGHVGIHNDDGSTGLNFGVGVTVIGGELSYQDGSGISAGASYGAEVGGHAGIRDQDRDGRPELCGGLVIGDGKVQGCLELPINIR